MSLEPIVLDGTKFYISTSLPATYNQAGYEALTFTQIRGMRSIGSFGKQWQTRQDNTLGKQTVNKRVGFSITPLNFEMIKITDAGQSILRAAIGDVATSYSYKLERPDGSVIYFTGTLASRLFGAAQASVVADMTASIEIDSDLLEID